MDITDAFKNSIINRVYSDFCKVIRVVGYRGEFYGEFPIDITTEDELLFENMPVGFELVPLDLDVRTRDTITAITSQFWTCNCKCKFVRHIGDCTCTICGTHISTSVERLPQMNLHNEPEWASHIGSVYVRRYYN